MNSVGSVAKSEWNWQANYLSPWRVTSLSDPVPKMCDAAHNGGDGSLTVWPFISPSSTSEYPSKPSLSHTETLSCILACILNIYLVHVPLTQFLSLGVGRKFSYIPFSFKACIPNGLLHGHFVYTYTPPHGEELVSFTSRHRWLLEISPLID